MSGLNNLKDEMTVGRMIELLSAYDKDLPLYFGAKLNFNTAIRVEYGDYVEHTVEFDDWLEFKENKLSEQAYRVGDKIKTRPVVVVEMDY